jgi:hypothetical protein
LAFPLLISRESVQLKENLIFDTPEDLVRSVNLLLPKSRSAHGALLPFAPIGSAIGLVPLPFSYFPWLIGILLSYCLVVQAFKIWFLNKFGTWI